MNILLKERSTYWFESGNNNHDSDFDYRGYFKIYYNQDLQYKNQLKTLITVEYYLQSYVSSGNEQPIEIDNLYAKINGASIGNYLSSTHMLNSGLNLTLMSTKTILISHNSSTGEASFKFQGFAMMCNWGGSSKSKSTSLTTYSMPKYNVGTTIANDSSSSTYKNFGTDIIFTLTKSNVNDTADVYYKIGDMTYNIAQATSDISLTYQFPTSLINNYPNNTQISLNVYCKTLSNNTIQQTTVYLSVPSNYIPEVSLELTDTNSICAGWGIYVKTKSILAGVITATGISGSTIIGYSTNINNSVISTQQFTTSELNPTIPPGEVSTIVQAVSVVTDSRSQSNTCTRDLIVYDYIDPTFIKCELKRCNEDGTLNSVGTYAKVVCQYKISSCNNNNSKSLIVTYGLQTKTFTLNNYEDTLIASNDMLFNEFDINSTYTFTFTLEDSFTSRETSVILKNSYITRSFKAGGKGIAFGEDAIEEGFTCAMDSNFKGVLKKNGVDIFGVVAYEDEIGSNSSITLSEDSANYDYIKIFYRNNDNCYSSVETDKPNGKKVQLNTIDNYDSNQYFIIFKCANANISGKKIEINHTAEWVIKSNGVGLSIGSQSLMYITKVILYKF